MIRITDLTMVAMQKHNTPLMNVIKINELFDMERDILDLTKEELTVLNFYLNIPE